MFVFNQLWVFGVLKQRLSYALEITFVSDKISQESQGYQELRTFLRKAY